MCIQRTAVARKRKWYHIFMDAKPGEEGMQIILIWTNNEVFVYTKQRVRMHKLNTHVLAWAAVGDNLGEN